MPDKKIPIIIGAAVLLLAVVLVFNHYFQDSLRPVLVGIKGPAPALDEAAEMLASNQKAIETAEMDGDFSPPPISPEDNIRGDLSAPLKIIAYFDYSCIFCADLAASLSTIMAENEGKIVLAARHFPMRMNPESYIYALALECAGEQDSYWGMHDGIFESIRVGTTSINAHVNIAGELGMDIDEFENCIDSESKEERIASQVEAAKKISVIGTPTMFINEEVHPGAVPLDNFIDSQEYHREGLRAIVSRLLAESAVEN